MRAAPLLLTLLLAGCIGPRAGTTDERTSDAAEMYTVFRKEVRENNVAQQYHYYSKTFKQRYNLFEYGLMVNGDPVIGGLFRSFVLDWPIADIHYEKDHKSGYLLLQHPKFPQYRKALDIVAEYDEKFKCDQWKIDFSCAKWMGLPDSLEVKLIEEEEKWRQKIKEGRDKRGGKPQGEEPQPEEQPPKEVPHD